MPISIAKIDAQEFVWPTQACTSTASVLFPVTVYPESARRWQKDIFAAANERCLPIWRTFSRTSTIFRTNLTLSQATSPYVGFFPLGACTEPVSNSHRRQGRLFRAGMSKLIKSQTTERSKRTALLKLASGGKGNTRATIVDLAQLVGWLSQCCYRIHASST